MNATYSLLSAHSPSLVPVRAHRNSRLNEFSRLTTPANVNLRRSLMVLDCQMVVRFQAPNQGEFMSTATASPKGKPKKARPAGLPDERFWIKYSPHHELPLSAASSVFVHAVAFGVIGLILAGFLSGLFGGKHPAEVRAIEVAGGGGGNPNGSVENPGESAVPTGAEAIETKPKNSDPIQPIDTKDLKTPTPPTEPLVSTNENATRLFKETKLSQTNLSDLARKANDRLASPSSKGQGGAGSGGGMGDGNGTGSGNEIGPGSGKGTISEARNIRWTMKFRTENGEDYFRQLRDIGAYLVVPLDSGEVLVFRDLYSKPLVGRTEDAATLPRLQWADTDPVTVRDVSKVLGLRQVPPRIIAVFPPKLEDELRKLEHEKFKGDENKIAETEFAMVRFSHGKYVPKVVEIRLKK